MLERVFSHECLDLVARNDEGSVAGVLPLVRVRSWLFGHYLVSMPFLNYGGPLGDDEAIRALTSYATAEAERSGADLLELRSRVELPVGLPVSHRKVTVLLDLPIGDPDLLWRALDAKVRSQVRRPQKEGVTIRFGRDQVEPFFEVFSRHMRDLGTPTHGRSLFDAIAEAFPDSVWFGVAWLGDRPIAGGCGFRWNAEFEMTWASSLRSHSRIAPNMLLYWGFMERCVGEGLRTFNFGRCTPGSSTHRFKRQWGGRDEQLWWYQHAAGRAATPSPDEGRFSWGPRVWRRLPVSAATMLGPRIVRYLP
jgi:FemAB-related protein (PEP-CTERM system-associated)